MTTINGSYGPFGGHGGLFTKGGAGKTEIAALSDRQYQRIVDHEENRIRKLYGTGTGLSAEEARKAQGEIDHLQLLKQARTAFLAQQLTQDDVTVQTKTASAGDSSDPGQAAIDKFREIQSKTPEERLFELLLKKRGLTQEELDALPPEEREKIIAEIKQEIREKVERKAVNTAESGTPPPAAGGSAAPGGTAPGSDPQAPGDGASEVLTINVADKLYPREQAGLEDVLVRLVRAQQFLSKLRQEDGFVPGENQAHTDRTADQAADGPAAEEKFV